MSLYSRDDIHKMVNVGFEPKFQINEKGALAGAPQHFIIDGFGKSWFDRRDEKFLSEAQADKAKLEKES